MDKEYIIDNIETVLYNLTHEHEYFSLKDEGCVILSADDFDYAIAILEKVNANLISNED